MNLDNQNLEWKLCQAYFSILEMNIISEVGLDQLCEVSKISLENVEKIVPENPINYKFFFLKILISKLDREVLAELQVDITGDTISSTYDKILEGFSLRFEKLYLVNFGLNFVGSVQNLGDCWEQNKYTGLISDQN